MTLLKRHLGHWLAAAALAGAASAAAQAPTPSPTSPPAPTAAAAAVPTAGEGKPEPRTVQTPRGPVTVPPDCNLDEAATKAWGRPMCLPPPPPPGTEAEFAQEQLLKVRAQRYWDALREGRHGDAWEFISPAGRLTITREAYALRMATVPLTAATVKEVLCRKGKCTATATVEYDVILPRVGKKRQSALESDTWMQQDGQLWLILR